MVKPVKYLSGSHGWGVRNGWLRPLIHAYLAQEATAVWLQPFTSLSLTTPSWWSGREFVWRNWLQEKLSCVWQEKEQRTEKKKGVAHKYLVLCHLLVNVLPPAWKCGNEEMVSLKAWLNVTAQGRHVGPLKTEMSLWAKTIYNQYFTA